VAESDPAGVRVAGIGGVVHFYGRARRNEMTEQERAGKIRALLEERRGYENRGEQSRVDLVNKALRDMGAEGVPPAQRAAKRVVEAPEVRAADSLVVEPVISEELVTEPPAARASTRRSDAPTP